MPSIPTGGLSIFIYGIILFIGGVLRLLKKIRVNTSGIDNFFNAFVRKEEDSIARHIFSWSISVSLSIVLVLGVGVAFFVQLGYSPKTHSVQITLAAPYSTPDEKSTTGAPSLASTILPASKKTIESLRQSLTSLITVTTKFLIDNGQKQPRGHNDSTVATVLGSVQDSFFVLLGPSYLTKHEKHDS